MSLRIAGSYWPSGWSMTDDVRAIAKRLHVAGLLVGSVAGIVRMLDDHEIEGCCQPGGVIGAAVID